MQGEGLVIDVQVESNKNRGNAVLKIYGPKENTKKENSVTISKSKESDSKFIVLLAEKVIKPLMNQFLSQDLEVLNVRSEKNKDNTDIDSRQYTCSFCEKACKTTQGLKSHITKMHLEEQSTEELGTEQKKRKINEEANEVVENLLDEIINMSEDEITVEEIVKDESEVKKYTKMCNNCDFKVEAHRKYISLQQILQHRDRCNFSITCPQCDKKLKDQPALKRHMRNEHSVTSCSISPPMKKKKEDLKIDFNFDETIEEMETDSCEVIEEDILLQRSRLKDEKVVEKQRRHYYYYYY